MEGNQEERMQVDEDDMGFDLVEVNAQDVGEVGEFEMSMLLWLFERDIFGMDDNEGRDIVIAASDGTQFIVHTTKLSRLFREMVLQGEHPTFSTEPVNFHFWEDGPTTEALLAFLNSNDKTLMGKTFHIASQLLMLGNYYKMEDVAAAALQVFEEKISVKAEWDHPESLWTLNSWIVAQTDKNNGEIPQELVALKGAIAKTFNRKVTQSRKHRVRSPVAAHNVFGNFWEMNINILL